MTVSFDTSVLVRVVTEGPVTIYPTDINNWALYQHQIHWSGKHTDLWGSILAGMSGKTSAGGKFSVLTQALLSTDG